MLHCIITTIQSPTESVLELARRIAGNGRLIVAGDTKGPTAFDLSSIHGFSNEQLTFLSIEDQLSSGFELANLLPTKHYSRKNIGYLQAIRSGASCIYETDDDNAPLASWKLRSEHIPSAVNLKSSDSVSPAWVNVYRHFSDENIWPRGLPLDRIHSKIASSPRTETGSIWAPIQQGLADGAPDVDAVWRLVLDREFTFHSAESAMLPPGQWCPFNTQTTWWWPVVYPLLYVPSNCSFRMCDIWKSFIAQRCLWELGTGVVFHAPEVWQERNVHSLIRDFQDEIPGYLQNNRLVQILEAVPLRSGKEHVAQNLRSCYEALIAEQIFPDKELLLVDAWLDDLARVSA
jgi:hypothetical protein